MTAREDSEAFERKLRPIYDALDINNYKVILFSSFDPQNMLLSADDSVVTAVSYQAH